ncbi:MAG: LacI family DNA-binding transcriptional regulator [Chloroflexota bacterium]
MKRGPTIDDVAKEAGVSRQTVSRAINNMTGISATTRERIMTIVDELGYRPNRLAQGMASKRSLTIGLIITDVTNPAHANVSRGIQDCAQSNNYNVFIRNTDSNKQNELEALNSFVSEGVDGIVLVGPRHTIDEIMNFADRTLPIVVVHRYIKAPYVASILADVVGATKKALEYLFGAGHRSIGLITRLGNLDNSNHLQGYKQAYQSRELTYSPDWVIQAERTLAGGYKGTQRLLSLNPEMTAIITYNDLMAIGAMKACSDMGRCVPDSVAIMGFDDIALSSYVTPSLSTIRFNGYEVGRVAMERLLDMVARPDVIFSPTLLDIELVIRDSTNAIK